MKFFDIHFHAMNLSHPNILAFISRFNITLLILSATIIGPLITLFAGRKIRRILNLLSVMENDIGNFFLLLEFSLKAWPAPNGEASPIVDSRLTVRNTSYDTIVLTPLMMDFGNKNIPSACYYHLPPQKPIAEQVIDLFNGINRYVRYELLEVPPDNVKIADRRSAPIFEIYPFLGLNPQNYTYAEIEALLKKYFCEYEGHIEAFKSLMGSFDGDISHLGSNYFIGIKVYPPLGFDPWPEKDPEELKKVEYLYAFASEKEIPITSHASDGGFITVKDSEARTNPAKWREVLNRFPRLKINLAHLGVQNKRTLGIFPRRTWQKKVLSLIKDFDRVYTDFSCLAFDDDFYASLRQLLDDHPKLSTRLLFGSDFIINLLWIESYHDYLLRFQKTPHLRDGEHELFCSFNPASFLFRKVV